MKAPQTSKSAPLFSVSRRELWWVIAFCVFAALRVLIFSAAFPFFNNVDERRHFDLVMKYAYGRVPRGAELISPATFPTLRAMRHRNFWLRPRILRADIMDRYGCIRRKKSRRQLLLAYLAARIVFPEQIAMRLGVPLLVASIPQDAFYGIDNNVLSPICFGITFICIIRWLSEDTPSISLGIATGLSMALTYLTKLSNLPLILVAILAITYWCVAQIRSRNLRNAILALSALVCCSAIPIAAWALWVKSHFGDFTGAASKTQLLGWTAKPFSEWWSHPIFTFSGLWTFLSELIASSWRGEFMWHARTIGSKGMDVFYVLSSLGLFPIAVAALFRNRAKNLAEAQRRALWIAAACFVATIVFLGFLSLQFDFGTCINPSRERPYFFQGRLMAGAMIPFATLYVYGLNRMLRAVRVLVLAAVGVIAITITVSEFLANRAAFTSAYNWFHM